MSGYCGTKRVCVFGASSSMIDRSYFDAAFEVGKLIGQSGWGLVFGAGDRGLMGAAARGADSVNCHEIIGVIPRLMNVRGIYYEGCTERIQTETMHERKALMESLSDAFIALAGGFGTIEEFMEVLTLKQLRYLDAPIVLVNTRGFFDELDAQLRRCVDENFTHEDFLKLYYVAESPQKAVEYIRAYKGTEVRDKLKTP